MEHEVSQKLNESDNIKIIFLKDSTTITGYTQDPVIIMADVEADKLVLDGVNVGERLETIAIRLSQVEKYIVNETLAKFLKCDDIVNIVNSYVEE